MERPSLSIPGSTAGLTLLHTLKGLANRGISSAVWSPIGNILASGSDDGTVYLWYRETRKKHLEGHTASVRSLAWSPNGRWLASGSDDRTIQVWYGVTRALIIERHTASVRSLAWSPDGRWLASGSNDGTIRLWDPMNGRLLYTLNGYVDMVNSVGWSPNGQWLASSSDDGTIRLWDTATRALLFEGHTASATSLVWSPDSQSFASSSDDGTIQLWDPTNGALQRTLEGHMGPVRSVAWSPNGQLLASVSDNSSLADSAPYFSNEVSIWRTDTWEIIANLTGPTSFVYSAWHPDSHFLATAGQQQGDTDVWELDLKYLLRIAASSGTIHYTNAKVVLVGDSGVGKSGLGLVLSQQPFTVTESTHGRRVWNFDRQEVSLNEDRRETRETWLWDLAGQSGYRLIHQLHLNEVTVALVVFDAHSEIDPFAGVRYWDRALRLAQRIQKSSVLPLKKFLVAARTDRGGVNASPERIKAVVEELGFDGYFATSAKEGWGIGELREAICQSIDWQKLPKVSSTMLVRRIKLFLLDEKQRLNRLISSVKDLYSTFLRSKDGPAEMPELSDQFETCIGRMESAGLIKRLSFGNLVLLQPELLDAYASALVNVVKDEPDGLGSIAEEQVRMGDFRIPSDERIQDAEQEKLLLIAMIEDLLRRELALREEGMLVFPSQSTKENPDLPDPEGKAVVFRFEGPVLNLYATLAVRLARSSTFKKKDLWKNAVTYTTSLGGTCGMYLRNIGEGRGDLTLFFDKVASSETRHTFTEYVHLYLSRRALPESFSVRYVLTCDTCKTVIQDNIIQLRRERNFDWLTCSVCDARVSLAKHVQQRTMAPSPRTKAMDQAADRQREHEATQSTLQGKIVTRDFDVFLCYNSEDKPAVREIGEQLKERGILPWLDEWELRPGLPWQRFLEDQIKQIRSAAVFVGKSGIGPWQQQELEAYLREFAKRGCPVMPVLLKDVLEKPELPVFLGSMTWVDFRRQDPDPLQRLLWGITGKRDTEPTFRSLRREKREFLIHRARRTKNLLKKRRTRDL